MNNVKVEKDTLFYSLVLYADTCQHNLFVGFSNTAAKY